MKLTINIDGGSRGNPGPAAYGCYLQPEGQPPLELKGKLGRATNNVAEYHGLLRALEKAIELGAEEILIRADSELLVRQMSGVYRVKNENILPLFQAAQSLLQRMGKVRFQHVYREQNQEADRLCNEALDDPRLPVEPLGLRQHAGPDSPSRPSVTSPWSKSAETSKQVTSKVSNSTETAKDHPESAKVKLTGALLPLMSLRASKKYAVVVQGTSWKLELLALPRGLAAGDRVVVLGELVLRGSTPIVRVKKIKKA
jgi:ribonuclease HI